MSKKLEGNGLWESSRMMLPQHKEQSMSIQNDMPSLTPEPPTRKEIEMMREYIILPVALKIVEKISLEVEVSSQTLKQLYSAAAKVLAKNIREDARKSQKALLERNIRVFEDSKDDKELVYRFVCRGREDRFIMTRDFMRAEIGIKIGRYVQNLIIVLQEGGKK